MNGHDTLAKKADPDEFTQAYEKAVNNVKRDECAKEATPQGESDSRFLLNIAYALAGVPLYRGGTPEGRLANIARRLEKLETEYAVAGGTLLPEYRMLSMRLEEQKRMGANLLGTIETLKQGNATLCKDRAVLRDKVGTLSRQVAELECKTNLQGLADENVRLNTQVKRLSRALRQVAHGNAQVQAEVADILA